MSRVKVFENQELKNLEGKVHILWKSRLKEISSQLISHSVKKYKSKEVPRHSAAYVECS